MRHEDYRPAYIEFDVAESNMPSTLGEFESIDEAHKFMGSNVVAVNQAITVQRHMDHAEKQDVRENYREVLEDTLPRLEREHADFYSDLTEAKKKEKEAMERVNAAISEAKMLAKEAKKGLKEIRLDDLATFRVPVEGKYYFYTYMDKQLKLCAVREIPESEKTEIWNASVDNTKFFYDGEVKAQEREEEQLS